MNSNKSNVNKPSKSAISGFLSPQNSTNLVSPVLRDVGKLAAGVASVSTNVVSGSATGNPRNKCSLQPGHSLMDWIRLGSSGKDLTGVGPQAGHLTVTRQELAKHNKRGDAWIAVRGKVFNVTEYLTFHPGGEYELMRGAGIDATQLFNEIHAWVNYEQILQKCLIGRLVATDPSLNVESLFFGEKSPSPSKESSNPSNDTRILVSPTPSKESPSKVSRNEDLMLDQVNLLPRFDWIQKTDYITIIFYTKAFCNPLVEIQAPNAERMINISLTYDDVVFKNEIILFGDTIWPCTTKVSCEVGKIEFVFKKTVGGVWEKYGVLRQQSKAVSCLSSRHNYVIVNKVQINHNIFLLRMKKLDQSKVVVPIGKHVKVYGILNGAEMSRSYTPIPETIFTTFSPSLNTTDTLCLMIKKYIDGNVSKYITNSQVGDTLEVSKPLGNFDLRNFDKRETFLLLAAGTGITPMFGIISFLLERRIHKCQFLRLLFFNKTQQDIPFKMEMDKLEKQDPRFRVDHILSDPEEEWGGLTGHITKEMVENSLQQHIKNTGYTIQDIYACVCGPNRFVGLTSDILGEIGFSSEQIHIFQG